MFIYLALLLVATAFASEEVLIAKDNSEYLKLQYIQPQSDEDVRFRLFMHLESNLDLLQTATSVCSKNHVTSVKEILKTILRRHSGSSSCVLSKMAANTIISLI